MATILRRGLIHVRKTIAFDGTANNGNLGDSVTVFTITGRVLTVGDPIIYCSETLVGAALSVTALRFGTVTEANLVYGADIPANILASVGLVDWSAASIRSSMPFDPGGDRQGYQLGENVVLAVEDNGGGADITDGTIIVDWWYKPITDDGALEGDDSDEELIDGFDMDEALRLILSALAGKVSGAQSNAPVFRDVADTKNRITAVTTSDGNRTGVTLDAG